MTEKDLNYNTKERDINLASIIEQLINQNNELSYIKALKSSISSNQNLFTSSGSEQEYYNKFLKYKSDNKLENEFLKLSVSQAYFHFAKVTSTM